MEDSCRLVVFDWGGTMCGDGIDRKALLSSSPSISQSSILKFLRANCEWHPRPRATGVGARESNRPTCTKTTTGFSRVGALILRGCYARSVGAQCCSWVLLSSPPRSYCRLRGAMNLYLIIMMRESCDNLHYHSYKYKYYKNNAYGICGMCGIKQHVLLWRGSVREEKDLLSHRRWRISYISRGYGEV